MVSCKSNLLQSQASGGLDLQDRSSCFRLTVSLSHATVLYRANRSILLSDVMGYVHYMGLSMGTFGRRFRRAFSSSMYFLPLVRFPAAQFLTDFFLPSRLNVVMSMRTSRVRFY